VIDTETDTFSLIEGLPNRAYDRFQLVGTKLYVGSNSPSTSMVVIDITVDIFTLITGLPEKSYSEFQLVGTKLYVGVTTDATSIIVIDTITDTFALIEGLPNRWHFNFHLVGTMLYVGSIGIPANNIVVIDTVTDTFALIEGLPDRWYNAFQSVGTKLYIGNSGFGATDIIVAHNADRGQPPPTTFAGIEYEQEHSALPDLVPPRINNVHTETLEPGLYKLSVSPSDCSLDVRANPFFFFSTADGTLDDYTIAADGSASVVFRPSDRGSEVTVGVGDGLGYIHRKTVLLEG
jgi:hypothetical protein